MSDDCECCKAKGFMEDEEYIKHLKESVEAMPAWMRVTSHVPLPPNYEYLKAVKWSVSE